MRLAALLAFKHLCEFLRSHCYRPFYHIAILCERVIRYVNAQHFLFLRYEDVFFKILHVRKSLDILAFFHRLCVQLEKRQLPFEHVFRIRLSRLYQTFEYSHMSCPVFAETVERSSLYQTLHRFLVYPVYIQIVYELEDILGQTLCLSRLYDRISRPFTHIFHAEKPEPYLAVRYGELLAAFVDVRRQHLYTHIHAVPYILRR